MQLIDFRNLTNLAPSTVEFHNQKNKLLFC